MIEDIESGKYKNNKEYPNYSYYKNLMDHGIDRMDEYKQKRDEYGKESQRLDELFWKDIEREFGTSNHPLKNALRRYAYEQGHSNGYSEIYLVYADLVDCFINTGQ